MLSQDQSAKEALMMSANQREKVLCCYAVRRLGRSIVPPDGPVPTLTTILLGWFGSTTMNADTLYSRPIHTSYATDQRMEVFVSSVCLPPRFFQRHSIQLSSWGVWATRALQGAPPLAGGVSTSRVRFLVSSVRLGLEGVLGVLPNPLSPRLNSSLGSPT